MQGNSFDNALNGRYTFYRRRQFIARRLGTMTDKQCVLDDRCLCTQCGECAQCDLDANKICDNCMRCVQKPDADYLSIEIDAVMIGDNAALVEEEE